MKKIGFLSLLTMATLLLTLAFPAAAAAPKAPATPAVVVVPPANAAPVPEAHPHIDEALEAMRNAKHHLESAEHDFDGHRMKAIEHLNQAIHEAEICMSMK